MQYPTYKKIKVKDLDTLELEIARLKLQSKSMEIELLERGAYLKSNFKGMAINSVVPGVANSGVLGILGKVGKAAWNSGTAKSTLTNILITAAEFIAVRFGVKLANKVSQKKKKKKTAKANVDSEG
ncbi:hypothetical protein COR50_05040 [Chitinophaga caeni]|uniref:Uncharacterized protein n=1 Tax=Chitinophaga caeni TaxID=2029983 RepID=A0A291QRP3_9BACT|nr:hypothetical protein [Chitinophaga caeni]ATL46596.1 hypothetical protein COR50_05040 [Chitinophaga caeni]